MTLIFDSAPGTTGATPLIDSININILKSLINQQQQQQRASSASSSNFALNPSSSESLHQQHAQTPPARTHSGIPAGSQGGQQQQLELSLSEWKGSRVVARLPGGSGDQQAYVLGTIRATRNNRDVAVQFDQDAFIGQVEFFAAQY